MVAGRTAGWPVHPSLPQARPTTPQQLSCSAHYPPHLHSRLPGALHQRSPAARSGSLRMCIGRLLASLLQLRRQLSGAAGGLCLGAVASRGHLINLLPVMQVGRVGAVKVVWAGGHASASTDNQACGRPAAWHTGPPTSSFKTTRQPLLTIAPCIPLAPRCSGMASHLLERLSGNWSCLRRILLEGLLVQGNHLLQGGLHGPGQWCA